MRSQPSVVVCLLFGGCFSGPLSAQFSAPASAGQSPRAQQLPLSGRPAGGTVQPGQTAVPGSSSVSTINSSIQVQGSYSGSVVGEPANSQRLQLTLEDAIRRGMQYNLGAVGAGNSSRDARALRLSALAQILPDITGTVRENVQQTNLAAQGLRIHVPIPGFTFPAVVGPFNYFDARASFTETLSLAGFRNWYAARETARSAELSAQDSRELVALAVSGAYLQLISAAARVQTATAQVETANTVYQQAVDRNKSGINARIDVNRSQVELLVEQQRVTSLNNDFEKQKLRLARMIGLNLGQLFDLTTTVGYHEPPPYNVDDLIMHALADRPDVRAAANQVKAAELSRKAATAEYAPSMDLYADYGATGITPTNEAHGTFTVGAAVRFPIFRSGRIEADIEQAGAVLDQRQAEYADAKGRAEQDVREAMLDLTASSQQVKVAESNHTLAADTLVQARDRFRAGVSDTVEVVQAQESVASAEQDYISALYAFNLARVSLARAIGQTEQGVVRLLQGQ